MMCKVCLFGDIFISADLKRRRVRWFSNNEVQGKWKEPAMAWFKLLSRIVIETKQFYYFRAVYFTKTLAKNVHLAGFSYILFYGRKGQVDTISGSAVVSPDKDGQYNNS